MTPEVLACFSDSECFYHFLFMCIGECVPIREKILDMNIKTSVCFFLMNTLCILRFNAVSNTTKPTLLESLCQEPKFIENTLSNTTKFTLLDSLRQDSDLSIKAYSLLQEVCINLQIQLYVSVL